MMARLKKIPVLLLLLVLFFCLHGSAANYGYLDLKEVLMIGFIILACLMVYFLLVLLISKNYLFTILFVFFTATWYLFFGAIQDWLKNYFPLSFISRNSALLLLLLAASFGWMIFLRRKKALHTRLLLYFNLLMLIYCGIDTVMIVQKYVAAAKPKVNLAYNFDTAKVNSKPNIYFLLFDEYPGFKSLQDSFGYPNSGVYDFLQQKQFKILPTFANYDHTVFSMSSMFNMQYVNMDNKKQQLNQHITQLRIQEIRHAAVFSIFKSMGYKLNNFSIFDIDDQYSLSADNSFLPVHSRLLTDKILHNRIIRTSGWMFQRGKFAIGTLKKRYMYQHDVNNKNAEKMLLKKAAQKNIQPQFSYAHFMMPHGPFYYDSIGNNNPDSLIDDNFYWPKAHFLSYLKYTNRFLQNLVTQIKARDSGAIIVIISDHGYRFKSALEKTNSYNFDNICAVYFPGNNYTAMKDKWSNVNFFPYLFNAAFRQNMPYLQDSIIDLKSYGPTQD